MKILISPAKSITKQELKTSLNPTTAVFISEAESLANKLKKFSVRKIENTMHVSNDIATLNHDRFQNWTPPVDRTEEARPAISLFTGEVYRGLDAVSMNDQQMKYAQENLRILSGMYGLLKPMDLMFPYRLEMGTKWAVTPKLTNLYKFWGSKISKELNSGMEAEEVIVNLASTEYFKAVDKKTLKCKIITPIFKDLKNGEYKVIMTFAKNARGKMTRYIIDNQLSDVNDVKSFDVDNYRFHESLSSENEWVFTR